MKTLIKNWCVSCGSYKTINQNGLIVCCDCKLKLKKSIFDKIHTIKELRNERNKILDQLQSVEDELYPIEDYVEKKTNSLW